MVHGGDLAVRLNKSNESLNWYGQAIKVAEENAAIGTSAARGALDGYRQRGKIYLSKGRFHEAAQDLRKVVNLKTSDKEGIFDRDVTVGTQQAIVHGKYKEAVFTLGPLIAQCELDREVSGIYGLSDLYLLRGINHWYRGYHAKARKDLEESYSVLKEDAKEGESETNLHLLIDYYLIGKVSQRQTYIS